MAVDGPAHTAYVTNCGSGTVSVIDTRSNTVTGTITVWEDSRSAATEMSLAVDSTTGTVYVINQNDGTVSVLQAR